MNITCLDSWNGPTFYMNIRSSKPLLEDVEGHLQRVLLRAEVIVDEAIGRHITNQAILLQLDMLRDAMHRGYYTLDTSRYQFHEERSRDEIVSSFWSLSKVKFVKGPIIFGRSVQILKQLQEVLDRLSSMIVDVDELVAFLTSYPRLYRQPYSMHILLGNCMFGRQMETELVVNFLLHTQPHGPEELEVLPIVGPGKVGKSTLVAHVCKDERVRDYFSEILFLHDHDFIDDERATFREVWAIKHKNLVSNWTRGGRLLIVVDLVGDLNEDVWNRLHSAFKHCVSSNSKVIVTSRSDKIVKFGTRQAMTLKYLPPEAYWYFFKTLAFGSMDPKMYPRFGQLAMDIARTMNSSANSSLIGANIVARLLRENFDIHFWCKVLYFFRGFIQNHLTKFGEHPFDLLNQNRPAHLWRMAAPSEDFIVSHQYQCSSQEEVPEIGMNDVMYGGIKRQGKFKALVWRSLIPPYHSYVYTCEIREVKRPSKRKRPMNNGITLC